MLGRHYRRGLGVYRDNYILIPVFPPVRPSQGNITKSHRSEEKKALFVFCHLFIDFVYYLGKALQTGIGGTQTNTFFRGEAYCFMLLPWEDFTGEDWGIYRGKNKICFSFERWDF